MRRLLARRRMWSTADLKRTYDIVVIGGGVHGLASAYYMAKRKLGRIAVLEQSYLGSGASGRNTTLVRSNYRTPASILFYDRSLRLYERLAQELDYNILFSQRGHLTVAHTESALNGLRERAENNRLLGVDSRLVTLDEIRRLVPGLDVASSRAHPIMGGLWHPPGGIVRHDAVVWGYAHAAHRLGVELHPFTRVTGITVQDGAVTGVTTSRGSVDTAVVVNATAGWCSTVARMAGVRLPVTTHTLQAFVTEPLKPWLHVVIVSANIHVYIHQTDRGEIVIGGEAEHYTSYSQRSTLPFLKTAATYTLELFPALGRAQVLRQWAGLCDMTPDFSPIMGPSPVRGFALDCGWGSYGFKSAPAAGTSIAELVDTGCVPELIRPFGLDRFREIALIGEKASSASAMSH